MENIKCNQNIKLKCDVTFFFFFFFFQHIESLRRNAHKKRFSFYDGPPFATGLPHYGHILAGTIKDIVTRFAHQTGHNVERRFGWDCHGLPVEYEIDKTLGITSGAQVEAMGIDKYNAECRAIVMRYASEWERIVTRLGRWIDFKNDYKTLNLGYMESVWWVISQLHAKGLLYRGFKVMPYSTAVHTPLSNFEASQAYKLVTDPAVYVTLPLRDDPATAFIAWTTTPWTLPSNMALTVHPNFTYVKVKDNATGAQYIVLESRLGDIFRVSKKAAKASKAAGGEEAPALYTVLEKHTGQELVGTHYVPLFDYYVAEMGKTAFRVIADKYVTDDAGTGVVHCAPAFGEDDYRVAIENGIIERGGALPCPVDDSGLFTAPVSDYVGQHVKEADKAIVEALKKKGRVYRSEVLEHQYPFCWRSDTPLIYRAVPSWFVRVEQAREKLLANSAQTNWVPQAIQEGRFHNWLANARDWAISRNRYWGTPLPVWTSDDFEEIVVVGSVAELEKYAGRKITDLHRESIDDILIPSPSGKKGMLRRVSEVLDCWMESGAMPYAQLHYPFENQKQFEESFPADFIAEGVDQTRGWFYTLMVLSTLLFDKPAFKNLIVNGLVLAEDGKKMSKRLKNYPDPMTVVDEHGADALRLYLINSPVVRASELRFSGDGVRDVVRDVFLPWYNSYRFLAQMTRDYTARTGRAFVPSTAGVSNTMDRWILASANSLVQYVRTEMGAYRLYTVVPRLVGFLTDLSNWYVRLNRRRLKGQSGAAGADDDDDDDAGAGAGVGAGGDEADTLVALSSLFEVLMISVRCMAPFTPFLVETMYLNMAKVLPEAQRERSVHFTDIPEVNAALLDPQIERAVGRMQGVIELARQARDRRTLPIKLPLPELVIYHDDAELLSDLRSVEFYIRTELNVVRVGFEQQSRGVVVLQAAPDGSRLGPRLGKRMGEFKPLLDALTHDQITSLQKTGAIELNGERFTTEDALVTRRFGGDTKRYEATWSLSSGCLVVLDTTVTEEARRARLVREVINRVQKLRKSAGLVVTDVVEAFYSWPSAEVAGGKAAAPNATSRTSLAAAIEFGAEDIRTVTRCTLLASTAQAPNAVRIHQVDAEVDGVALRIVVCWPALAFRNVAGNDALALAAEYFASRDYALTSAALRQDGKLTATVNGQAVTLERNKHVFLNASEAAVNK
jgi:isoleucyl-tRNA synthetase